MADIIRAQIEASVGTDLKKLEEAQHNNLNSIDDSDYEIALLLKKMEVGGGALDIIGMVEVDDDAIARVEARKEEDMNEDEGAKKKFVSPYANKKPPPQVMSEKKKKEKKLFLSNILGSKEGPSKKDLKKWKQYMDQAVQTKKVCQGVERMIQVSIDMPEKTTADAIREQKFLLKKHLEEIDVIQIGLDSAVPYGQRTPEQEEEYTSVFDEEWKEAATKKTIH